MVENVIQIKIGITINVNVSAKIWENICEEKYYIWKTSTCTSENANNLGSIIDNSLVLFDQII